MKSVKEEKCKNKALHGQYPKILEKPHDDTVISNNKQRKKPRYGLNGVMKHLGKCLKTNR